ncbi:hypothetical protein EZS27_004364 [termite gut metagenome]|uniref:Uncharacterized protein n=1 Tax=termite gut metagenome TaxID=433724 RepID=A0A5J4SQG6_9ZZZZ
MITRIIAIQNLEKRIEHDLSELAQSFLLFAA